MQQRSALLVIPTAADFTKNESCQWSVKMSPWLFNENVPLVLMDYGQCRVVDRQAAHNPGKTLRVSPTAHSPYDGGSVRSKRAWYCRQG
jgi:hypothetical protein